jgi:triacylglycerol lipase
MDADSITNHTLSIEADSLAYLKSGTGPAVIIVHGIGGHKEDWREIMRALASRQTVYAIDMMGFGASSKTSAEITIATQVGAISALMTAEKLEKTDLIGNSVGGWVAAQFAATHAESTRRLVLVDAAGFEAMFEGPPPANFYPGTVEEMQKLLSLVRYSDLAHTRGFAERALKSLEASGDAQAAERVFQGLFVSPRLEELMPKITTPTLVVWGAEDKLFPPVIANLVHGGIKGSSTVLIPKASHFPHIDNPESFLAAVTDFLKR